MKQIYFVSVIVITLLSPLSIHAETFCISDATGLQDALTIAANNGEDDTIQIEQGIYIGNFRYTPTEAYNLIIEGGYTPGCGLREVNPANTVLDANGYRTAFILETSGGVEANLVIDGLTLRHGGYECMVGGIRVHMPGGGDVTISNNIISENWSECAYDEGFGGGSVVGTAGNITFSVDHTMPDGTCG